MTTDEKLLAELNPNEFFNVLKEEAISWLLLVIDDLSNEYKTDEKVKEFIYCLFGYLLRKNPKAMVQLIGILKNDVYECEAILMLHYKIYNDLDFIKYAYDYIKNAKPKVIQSININELDLLTIKCAYNELDLLNTASYQFLNEHIMLCYIEKILNL